MIDRRKQRARQSAGFSYFPSQMSSRTCR